jgi:hypothetical protein
MAITYQVHSTSGLRSHWAVKHYYFYVAGVGAVMSIFAGPISLLFQSSLEERVRVAEEDIENFIYIRDRDVFVAAGLYYGGFAMLFAAVALFAIQQVRAHSKSQSLL